MGSNWSQHLYHLHIAALRWLLHCNFFDSEYCQFESKVKLKLNLFCCEWKNDNITRILKLSESSCVSRGLPHNRSVLRNHILKELVVHGIRNDTKWPQQTQTQCQPSGLPKDKGRDHPKAGSLGLSFELFWLSGHFIFAGKILCSLQWN